MDKVAQLEAIDWHTLEFSQSKYDEYIKEQANAAPYSVESNQKVIKERMDMGRKFEESLGKAEIVYGRGGVNRYWIDVKTGKVKLLRGVSNTSGNPEYKAKLAQKAKELGFMVDE